MPVKRAAQLEKPNAKAKEIAALSIDNVIFGLDQQQLKVLLVRQRDPRHKGKWALPGGWIREDEHLRDASSRLLRELTGITDLYMEQLKTFGKVDRFPGARVITVAYYALVSADSYQLATEAEDVSWHAVLDVSDLVYDHMAILSEALAHLRREIRYRPIGLKLLPTKFTLLDLQQLYEAILGVKLDKGNFRRKVLKSGLLEPCEEKQIGVSHRAATLYQLNNTTYNELVDHGFPVQSFV
jgi:hypothetical protein